MSTSLQLRHPARTPFAAVACIVVLLNASGCQTPQNATVAAPATGMIGQPAQYGSWATPPQGAAYPPTMSAPAMPMAPPAGAPMPGPATQWQAAAPTAPGSPAAPPANSWSWSQPATGAPGAAPPSMQQYGAQLQNTTNQYAQGATNQAQQYANQMQAQPQQWANQAQQYANQQTQQLGNQMQNTANQYTQGATNQVQQGMQSAQQQVTAQMPAYQAPPSNTSWNPFATSAQSLPPARATPTSAVPRY
ncbi:MAG: hypothetical protein ACR2IT_02900 [Pirellulales bacterium]